MSAHHHHTEHHEHTAHHHHTRPVFEHLNERHNRLAAWFLGPKAENAPFLRHFFNYIATQTEDARNKFQPEDPKFIDAEIQSSSSFQQEMKDLDEAMKQLTDALSEHSIPFWSPRYNAHMTYDTSMPALLGYLATTLYNPNNVATEASPLTSVMEKEVGLQLCEMLGYDVRNTKSSRTWGHITCGGSIANLESIWAARNLKFYPLSLACALEPGAPLASIKDEFEIELCTGEKKLFSQLKAWDLLNLKPETVFEIPERLENEFGISSTFLSATMNKYLIQSIGKDVLEKKFGITKPTRYFVGGTKHYSWPKGAALTGIGSDNIIDIPVDTNARLDSTQLDRLLQECLDEKRAVYAVVAIMGSTEHGAVDPLKDVVELRTKYQKQGLSFAIHADAAWGGYFASLLREEGLRSLPPDPGNQYVPELALSSHTRTQLEHLQYADSITIDPHKSGYIPYPAGGLCYRDGRMRFLVTWLNPDVYKDSDGDEGMGVYGVEGSKPGAAPVAAWVSHRVIGLHKNGYGSLLGEAMFSCTKMYSNWVTMDMDDRHLVVVPLNATPAEREGKSKAEIQKEREYIRDHVVNRPNLELVRDEEAMKLVRELGSDLSINAFACNFRLANGEINQDVVESNYLNTRIYDRLSVTKIEDNIFDKPLFIMSTCMEQKVYGECCNNLKKRLGLVGDQDLDILVNCVMSPFPTVANFTKSVADDFKKIANEEIKKCLFRNTITEDDFRFIVQGTDKPYLTLLPMFNMANYRHQLILSCDIPESVLETYRAERAKDPSAVFYIGTTKDVRLESILAGSFDAMLEKGLPSDNQTQPQRYASDFQVTNIKVLKDSPIDSKYLDHSFPDYMYFYLYGTKEQKHIEHMLVSSSNVQLTSDQVDLQLSSGDVLSEADLAKGLIVRLDSVHENIVLPVLPPHTPPFFKAGKELKVSIFQDPHAADSHGPGLTIPLSKATPIASGTMTLGKMVYTDSVLLNGNPTLDGTLEVEEGVSGKTLEERLKATRRTFVPEDHKHVDSYYKRRDKQAAWRHYVEDKLSSIGHDTAGGRPHRSQH
ncbi:pyridoxal-dependent decarboxylase domain protein [Rhizoctonia solani 123E]|uniref:Pyridoxal-dependent decarboxylase domain protein n=1 Tax=Rhizoctonia solani 123E TaxID=1423351 RepID=A0A074RLU8_9AGAM|nr:pyridoxal-dependent decarboxylase domain protein [Rhizoctonia solani 123E]